MDLDQFWKIIDASQERSGGDPERQLEVLRDLIDELSPEEIIEFDRHFESCVDQAYRWNLWAAAYILGGGCSDDGFIDFRASLVGRGRKIFEAALDNPDSMARIEFDEPEEECFFEGFQYVAMEVYEDKTGNELPQPEQDGPSAATEPAGERWEETAEDLEATCPNLWKLYGWDDD